MQIGLACGALLAQIWMDFGAKLGSKLEPSWPQNLTHLGCLGYLGYLDYLGCLGCLGYLGGFGQSGLAGFGAKATPKGIPRIVPQGQILNNF